MTDLKAAEKACSKCKQTNWTKWYVGEFMQTLGSCPMVRNCLTPGCENAQMRGRVRNEKFIGVLNSLKEKLQCKKG